MKILITGASGFIGSHFLASANEEDSIFAISNSGFEHDLIQKTFSWSELDELPEVDVCIHLAGLAHDLTGKYSDSDYVEINYELTRDLLHALTGKCNRFIFLSSIKAVCNMNCIDLQEDCSYHPSSAYGLSKQMAEQYIIERSKEADLSYIILRPVMVYGSGSKGNVNALISLVKRGIPYPFAKYKNEKSVLYIKNLIHVIDHFISNKNESGIYHVSDPGTLSTSELVDIMSKTMNKNIQKWNLPSSLYQRMVKSSKPGKLRSMFAKLLGDLSVDNSKLQKALGENKLPFTTEEGFKDFLSASES
jgi:nucleoside-diphosphate-sugar epimerase